MSWSDIEGNKEPKFMKLYIEDLGKLKQLTGTQRVVLDVLMKYYQLHLQGFTPPNSITILQQVFG